jgi:nitrate/nitrite-specific signal transduction histidine kinase
VDEETQRYAELVRIKYRHLHELDKQAAALGQYNTPPHIEMQRQTLMEELGMMETALDSPASARVNYQQNREIKQSIARVAVQLETFIAQSEEWRTIHRNWIVIIGLVVILILVAVVALVTFLITKGAL